MSEHVSTERMNEVLDGLLPDVEVATVEQHLEACAACRNEYARITETVRSVASLPRDARAPDGTWEAIAARIGSGAGGAGEGSDDVAVYTLPTAAPPQRRLSFSIPEAMAAGIAVALVSAGLMWAVVDSGGRNDAPATAAVEQVPGGAAARAVALEGTRYAEVVGQLEAILEEGRSLLTPETLASIEQSLTTIDAAIADIESALSEDPSSDLLQRLLASHQRTRLGVLQRAAAAVQAQT